MKVAIEGCAHGDLDKIYASLRRVQEKHNVTIDLLICCGDFESVRDAEDLENLTCAPQHRHMRDFHKYYTGEKIAPVTTIFIGGNHEVPGFLRELCNGGWVAPNIYYLGTAGVLRVGPLRIAGMSGSFRPQDFFTAHHECPPYTDSTRRSGNNVREWDVARLARVTEPIDIVVSHDWPRGIWKHGNCAEMLDSRDESGDLRREMDSNSLGSLAAMELLKKLRPGFWFSAHLHVKFAALVSHEDGTFTRFLALDRCQARKDFLQVLDIDPRSPSFLHRMPAPGGQDGSNWGNRWRRPTSQRNGPPIRLDYDPEWLAIQKVNHAHLSFSSRNQKATVVSPTKEDIDWVVQRLREKMTPISRQRASTRRHSSLLPTMMREASGEKSFRDLSTAQLRELFETRGLEFPGHMDKASLIRQLEEHDEFFAAERDVAQTAADEAFPIPENFVPERENAALQRCKLLEILELPDLWKEQEEERKERMHVQTSGYDPVSEALTSEMEKELPVTTSAGQSNEPDVVEVITTEHDASMSPSSPMVVAGSPVSCEGDQSRDETPVSTTGLGIDKPAVIEKNIDADASCAPEVADAQAATGASMIRESAESGVVGAEVTAEAEKTLLKDVSEATIEGVDKETMIQSSESEVGLMEEAENNLVSQTAETDPADIASRMDIEEPAVDESPDVVGDAYASEGAQPNDAIEDDCQAEVGESIDDDAYAAFIEAGEAMEELDASLALEANITEQAQSFEEVGEAMCENGNFQETPAATVPESDSVDHPPSVTDMAGHAYEFVDHDEEAALAASAKVALRVAHASAAAEDDQEVQEEITALENALAELEATDAILEAEKLEEEIREAADEAEDAAEFDPYASEELVQEPPVKIPRLA